MVITALFKMEARRRAAMHSSLMLRPWVSCLRQWVCSHWLRRLEEISSSLRAQVVLHKKLKSSNSFVHILKLLDTYGDGDLAIFSAGLAKANLDN
jgi:hypothetical protein